MNLYSTLKLVFLLLHFLAYVPWFILLIFVSAVKHAIAVESGLIGSILCL